MSVYAEVAESRITQMQCESEGWKRALEFIQHENILRKNRLAEVLRNSMANTTMLEEAENFLHGFIQEETLIELLRHDIQLFDSALLRQPVGETGNADHIQPDRKNLSAEVGRLGMAFAKNNLLFDRFLEGLSEEQSTAA